MNSFKLKYPVQFEGKEVSELSYRRLKGIDIKDGQKHSEFFERIWFFCERSLGTNCGILGELDSVDLAGFMEMVTGFLEPPAAD